MLKWSSAAAHAQREDFPPALAVRCEVFLRIARRHHSVCSNHFQPAESCGAKKVVWALSAFGMHCLQPQDSRFSYLQAWQHYSTFTWPTTYAGIMSELLHNTACDFSFSWVVYPLRNCADESELLPFSTPFQALNA